MTAIDLTSALRRRQRAADRSRALARSDVVRLLTREEIGIRERTLWRLLYETAARSAEVQDNLGHVRSPLARQGRVHEGHHRCSHRREFGRIATLLGLRGVRHDVLPAQPSQPSHTS